MYSHITLRDKGSTEYTYRMRDSQSKQSVFKMIKIHTETMVSTGPCHQLRPVHCKYISFLAMWHEIWHYRNFEKGDDEIEG